MAKKMFATLGMPGATGILLQPKGKPYFVTVGAMDLAKKQTSPMWRWAPRWSGR